MLVVSFLLDGLTLFFLFAYALSALVSLLPNQITSASAGQQVREARRRLLLPPVGAAVLVAIGLGPFPGSSPLEGPTHAWFHVVGSSTAEATHDLAALAVLAVWAGLLVWHAYGWGRARGHLNLLRMLTDPAREASLRQILADARSEWPGALQVIDCRLPLCFVLGRSRLILSAALLEELTPEQLLAIVAHELAHVQRQDNLWRLILKGTQLAHLPFLGRRAYRHWAQCAELACDEAASRRVGAICVAETLVRFQRLINRCGLPPAEAMHLGSAFGGSLDLQTRVEWLLNIAPRRTGPWWLSYWPPALLLVVLTLSGPIHTLLEHLLELLHA